MDDEIQRRWQSLIRRLAHVVNFGWWLDAWLPLSFGICLIGAVGILLWRALALPHEEMSWAVIGGAIVVTMIPARFIAGRRFESLDTSRVRLEDALELRARLTAAAQGVCPWPAYPLESVALPLQWRWRRPLGLACFSLCLLILANWVPVPHRVPPKPRIIEKPTAVKQVEAWIDQLRKDNAVKPELLDDVEKKIEDMLKRPADQWYEHASLEAAENLRDETGKELQELGSNLEQTQGTLSTLAQLGSQLSEESKKGLNKQLQQSLQGLRSGAMQAGEDLQKQLAGMDAQALNGMSQEQIDKLQQRLKQNAQALREALANAPQFSFSEHEKKGKGNGDGEGEGEDGDGDPGSGAATRGRGDAELTVKKKEVHGKTDRDEAANPMIDPERVAPGDLLGTSDGKHRVDKNATVGGAGGAIQNAGEGGSAVWKETLVPAEREVLRRYFK